MQTIATPPAAYAPDTCAKTYNVGRTTLFAEIKAGRLKARKLGRRTLILRADAEAWANALPVVEPRQ